MNVAVVGAGLAGLNLSRRLVDAGVEVQIFDKGRFPGGRLATRDKEQGAFDHGAQRFTARDPEFQTSVSEWEEQGWVQSITTDKTWWIPTPSARQLALNIGQGIPIETSTRIQRAQRKDGRWLLDANGQTLGPFDVLIITAPAPQALALLHPQHRFAETLRTVHYDPTWALFLCGEQESPMKEQMFTEFGSGPIQLIVRENLKPGREPDGPFERLTVHASTTFSIEHLEDAQEDVQAMLLEQLERELGAFRTIIHSQAHRWRYARVPAPLGVDFLYDSAKSVGLAGDYFLGSRVESAALSGLRLADQILHTRQT